MYNLDERVQGVIVLYKQKARARHKHKKIYDLIEEKSWFNKRSCGITSKIVDKSKRKHHVKT